MTDPQTSTDTPATIGYASLAARPLRVSRVAVASLVVSVCPIVLFLAGRLFLLVLQMAGIVLRSSIGIASLLIAIIGTMVAGLVLPLIAIGWNFRSTDKRRGMWMAYVALGISASWLGLIALFFFTFRGM